MKEYAVVVYYTFDSETCVYLFDTYEKACNYLQKMWEYCFNSEIANNESEIDFDMTYHEEDYAQIKWNGNDNPMRIWQVTGVSEPMKIDTTYIKKEELPKYWEKKSICIEFPDGTDALAQENGYTLEQCLKMEDVKFFLDWN